MDEPTHEGPVRYCNNCTNCWLTVLAFIFPPISVAIKIGTGIWIPEVLIVIVLWVLGYLPGLIYSLFVIHSGKYDREIIAGPPPREAPPLPPNTV